MVGFIVYLTWDPRWQYILWLSYLFYWNEFPVSFSVMLLEVHLLWKSLQHSLKVLHWGSGLTMVMLV